MDTLFPKWESDHNTLGIGKWEFALDFLILHSRGKCLLAVPLLFGAALQDLHSYFFIKLIIKQFIRINRIKLIRINQLMIWRAW